MVYLPFQRLRVWRASKDLSCSIGKMGRFEDDDVKKLILRAEETVLSSGCLLAGFQVPGRSVKEMFLRGYSLVCGSVDVGLLRNAALSDMLAAQEAIDSFHGPSSERSTS